jgi:hypothetical protein
MACCQDLPAPWLVKRVVHRAADRPWPGLALAHAYTARPAWLRPLARSHDHPGVPGDRSGRPAHLVGQLGGPVGIGASAL